MADTGGHGEVGSDMAVRAVACAFTLNGTQVERQVRPDATLLDLLAGDLGLNSVRGTCGIGVCGTCTVMVDGLAVSSCIMPAAAVDGRTVLTSEGAAHDGELARVQQAFVASGAFQCSYCIPAMAVSVRSFLSSYPDAGPEDFRELLGGNLCRCGTYPQVLDAVARLREPK